ncbi:MAG: hypothetical protein LUM44_20440, partial [Pyrinomonadaceae bacterium]|nr:hypothetical protein [Pyrinomonadaceae bacterium]
MSLILKSKSWLKVISLLVFLTTTIWAAGGIDTGFNAAAYQLPGYSETPIIKAQPDGKLLVALYEFGVNNGIAAQGISRFNPDGTVDTSFRAPRLETGRVFNFGLQSNGKILLCGDFRVENSQYEDIARLNPDGSLDTTFNYIATPLPQYGEEIFVQPDDSFFIGTVYKFDANGFPDQTFNYQPYFEPARSILGLPDGKVYVSAGFAFNYLYRHNADGTRDTSFSQVNVGNPVRKMVALPDGKLLIAGNFSTVNSVFVGGIARINPDGSLDQTFNAGGSGVNAFLNDMEVLPNGKIIITGGFDSYNGVTKPKVARLNADGSLDTSFNYTGRVENVAGIRAEIIGGGRIMLGGFFYSTDQLQVTYIALNPDGSQVPDFYIQKALAQKIRKTTVASNGKIYVAGEFSTINGYQSRSLARLNPDGKVDTSFVAFFNTQFGFNPVVHQLVEQPDGKLLVSFSNYAVVARMNPNGTRDTSFNPTLSASSAVYDLALQTDGKIIIVGEVFGGAPIFSRLNANGSQDTSLNQSPNGRVFRVLVQPDGKIIIVGEFTQISGSPRNRIARFNSDGTLDNTFSPDADAGIYDVDLQTDGKIIIGGAFGSINGNPQCNKVARLNSDGSLDTGFAQSVDNVVQTVKAQSNGKVLIGGSFTNVGGTLQQRLARLNVDGSRDSTFNATADGLVLDINLQADGKVLVAGEFVTVNNVTKLGVARLNNTVMPFRTRFDFDGDGRADIGVFRPSNFVWY